MYFCYNSFQLQYMRMQLTKETLFLKQTLLPSSVCCRMSESYFLHQYVLYTLIGNFLCMSDCDILLRIH